MFFRIRAVGNEICPEFNSLIFASWCGASIPSAHYELGRVPWDICSANREINLGHELISFTRNGGTSCAVSFINSFLGPWSWEKGVCKSLLQANICSHIALRIRSFHASWVWPICSVIHRVEQKVNPGELNGFRKCRRGWGKTDTWETKRDWEVGEVHPTLGFSLESQTGHRGTSFLSRDKGSWHQRPDRW